MSEKSIIRLTAKEAKQLSVANSLPIEKAMEQIKMAAETGHTFAMFHNLHEAQMMELINLEYRVSKFIDFAGVQLVRVEW